MEEHKSLTNGSFPTLGDLLALFGLFFVIQIGITLVAMLILLVAGSNVTDLAPQAKGLYIALTSLCSMVGATIAFFAYGRVRNAAPFDLGLRFRPFKAQLLIWGYLIMVALSVVTEPLYNLLPPLDQQIGSGIWAAVAVVVIAPLFEELLCRGFLYGALRRRHGRTASILLSALFFGLLHLQPTAVVNAFLIGVLLAYLYDRTATLWLPILLHALNNATAFVMLQFGDEAWSPMQLFAGQPLLYAVIYLAALLLLGVAIWQLRERKSGTEEEKNSPTM